MTSLNWKYLLVMLMSWLGRGYYSKTAWVLVVKTYLPERLRCHRLDPGKV